MIRSLLALLFVSSVAHAVDLPGTWSNGESEFQTISVMLRSDGQAVFATAVLQAYALWEKNDTGLTLTLGESGKSLPLSLTYDPASSTLTGTLRDTRLVLRKVSDHQPPDLLARAKAKQTEEQARWQKLSRHEDRTLADRNAVRALLAEWLSQEKPNRAETIFISATDNRGKLTLRYWAGRPALSKYSLKTVRPRNQPDTRLRANCCVRTPRPICPLSMNYPLLSVKLWSHSPSAREQSGQSTSSAKSPPLPPKVFIGPCT